MVKINFNLLTLKTVLHRFYSKVRVCVAAHRFFLSIKVVYQLIENNLCSLQMCIRDRGMDDYLRLRFNIDPLVQEV